MRRGKTSGQRRVGSSCSVSTLLCPTKNPVLLLDNFEFSEFASVIVVGEAKVLDSASNEISGEIFHGDLESSIMKSLGIQAKRIFTKVSKTKKARASVLSVRRINSKNFDWH